VSKVGGSSPDSIGEPVPAIDAVVEVGQDREEAVDERIDDPVEAAGPGTH
jgi:hypothetical protein